MVKYNKEFNLFELTSEFKNLEGHIHEFTKEYTCRPTRSQIKAFTKEAKVYFNSEFMCYRCYKVNKRKDLKIHKEFGASQCTECKCRTFFKIKTNT